MAVVPEMSEEGRAGVVSGKGRAVCRFVSINDNYYVTAGPESCRVLPEAAPGCTVRQI